MVPVIYTGVAPEVIADGPAVLEPNDRLFGVTVNGRPMSGIDA
jgi:hypothetical protein